MLQLTNRELQQNAIRDKLELRGKLLGSLLLFTQVFYKIRTGREFVISEPVGRESHHVTIAKALTRILRGDVKGDGIVICVPPRYGKSEMLISFVAWALAHYPDSQFIYTSYAKSLAKKQTQTVKNIMTLPLYSRVFDVGIKEDVSASDNFETGANGAVLGAGAGGPILGRGAGLQNCQRFGGAIIIDDIHKADEVHSEVIRESINDWFFSTLYSRRNNPTGTPKTPIIYIGQRLHEDDMGARLIMSQRFELIELPALDVHGNALHPAMHDRVELLRMQQQEPYIFASQMQQNPQPAGGGIFKRDWFVLLSDEPEILKTFITSDTAETDKDYNDATVFSFWGLYKIRQGNVETDIWGLHWIDCMEVRVEPADLEATFMQFYNECMLHPIKPLVTAIEKKSTGITLTSILKKFRGLRIIEIERTRASGNKTARFLSAQPLVAAKKISLPLLGKHTEMCLEHCRKITANNSHRHDDICIVGSSKIALVGGEKQIKDVRKGDKVITPFGIGVVSHCGISGFRKVVNNVGLIGTDNHPVFYKDSFLPLITVPDMIRLDHLSFWGLLKWRQKKLWYLMVFDISLLQRADIIVLAKLGIKMNSYIRLFGNFIAAKQYRKIMLFIIRTIINLITITKIWSVYRLRNIARFILKESRLLQNVKRLWKKCGPSLANVLKIPQRESFKKKLLLRFSIMAKKFIAQFAPTSLLKKDITPICVAHPVEEFGLINGVICDIKDSHYLNQSVSFVEKTLPQKVVFQKKIIEKPVLENAQDDTGIVPVYNLTIEGYGVYYANNILVSNCDTLADACDILRDELLVGEFKRRGGVSKVNIKNPRMEAAKIRSRSHANAW